MSVSGKVAEHIVSSFENLVDSVLSLKNDSHDFLPVLMNYTKLIPLVQISNIQRKKLREILKSLLNSENFLVDFCSHTLPDARQSVQCFKNFISYVEIRNNGIDFVENFLNCKKFDDFCSRLGEDRIFLFFHEILLKENSITAQNKLLSIAMSPEEIQQKLQRIYLFLDKFTTKKNLIVIQNVLNDNINTIPHEFLYSFIFKDLIHLTKKNAADEFQNFLRLDRQYGNHHIVPNPIDQSLAFICIMKISGIIEDLTPLAEIAPKYPILHFLIDSKKFDYSQVDFSNYMWQNYVKQPDLRQKLIEHKAVIMPKIKKKLKIGEASDFEKIVLYRYFLNDDEIWKM